MNPSPFVRASFWTYTIGMTTTWIAKNGISQCCVQRFLAVPDIRTAKKAVWIFMLGLCVIKIIASFGGLIAYAKYHACDPVKSGKIAKLDQIMPYFVMQESSMIPGLPGLFIAGIFSAALSSMSSSLNTISGTIYEDFIRHRYPNATEKRASDVMKLLVVILGTVTLSLVFVVEQMGQIFRLNFVIAGLFVGIQLGMFSIGMMTRSANSKGVICGAIGALLVVGTVIVGAQSLPKPPPLPVRVDGCDPSLNVSLAEAINLQGSIEDVPLVFQLSFMYYALLGTIVLFLIALPVSWITGGCEPFDERLLTPLIRGGNWKDEKASLFDKLDLNSNAEKAAKDDLSTDKKRCS